MNDLSELLQFCTENQRLKLEAVIEHGSRQKAADALGCCKTAVTNAVTAARLKATQRGFAPSHDMTKTVPEGFTVKGVSTLYDDEGNVKVQWVKSQADKERQGELLRIFAEGLSSDIKGKSKIVKLNSIVNSNLLAGFPIPEIHNGMFSWGKQTGDDYDCNIAAEIMDDIMQELVAASPPAETALLSSLGDLTHTDNPNNVTAKAGNQLDVDSRWERVVMMTRNLLINTISLLLTKYKKVIVKGVGGNHDPQTSFMLAVVLDSFYSNNPRVEVDLSPRAFKFHRFGKNLIGVNHGHMAKPGQLPLIMANDMAKDWGETIYRTWWTGHIHHLTRKEYTGCTVETFRSIASKDSWHYESGYRALRDAQCIIYHKEYGEQMRITRPVIYRGEIQRHTVAI